MIATLLEWCYYGLKAIGLWDKLLAVHKAKEINNAIAADNRLSDSVVSDRLRNEFTRDN